MIRYHAAHLLPISRPPIRDGTVVVHGGQIVYAGERAGAPPGADRDLGDAILLPGLVNAHTHLELTAMRGFLEDLSFGAWIDTLQRAKRAVLTPERMLDAARLGVAEGIMAGITTFADTCDSGVAMQALREAGVRGIMYQEVFGPAPAQCEIAVAELRAKVATHRALESQLVRVGISPHAPYTVSDDLFAAASEFADAEGLPMAIHIAESEEEQRLVVEGAGAFADGLRRRGIAVEPRARSPIALLAALGVLAHRPMLIHCVRADERDIAVIADSGSPVAHCPVSNAKLGHGIAPLARMLGAGIRVGLGSDSVASSNRMDMLEEARVAALAQRAHLRSPEVLPAREALELATLGGARALGLDARVGSLEPGKDADLVAFPAGDLRTTPIHDPAAAAVFGIGGHAASFVMVGGEVLVDDGRLFRADPGLAGRVRATAAALAGWRAAESGRGARGRPDTRR